MERSLHDILHEKNHPSLLTWNVRFNIASKNILIDDNMKPIMLILVLPYLGLLENKIMSHKPLVIVEPMVYFEHVPSWYWEIIGVTK